MEFRELLEGQGLTSEQVGSIQEQMSSNSFFLTTEENIELRYEKANEQLAETKAAFEVLQVERQELEASLVKATDELGSLQSKIELDGLRKETAKEFSVPEELIAGSNADEVRASAEKLQPYFKTPAAPVVPSDGKKPAPAKPSPEREVANKLFGKE